VEPGPGHTARDVQHIETDRDAGAQGETHGETDRNGNGFGAALAPANPSRSDQTLRQVPSRRSLVNMLDHFMESLQPADVMLIQVCPQVALGRRHAPTDRVPRKFKPQSRAFQGRSIKKTERRWHWLAGALGNRYDLDRFGGVPWLLRKTNFGRWMQRPQTVCSGDLGQSIFYPFLPS